MLELLAAFPTGVWVAALLIVAVGGLCAALAAADRTESDPRPVAPAPRLHLDDIPWDAAALDDDPIWASGAVAS